ncbi:MAG: tRNA-specific 2-thiouridylase [Desulfovibrio sp.]|nr:tRNA-specific 2-thiouridylase [Desulfovibrio sp.]
MAEELPGKAKAPEDPASLPPAGTSVAVAVSGGVDSLCALLMLREAGCDVHALHGVFLPGAMPAGLLSGLQMACSRLGVPLHVLDFSETFSRCVRHPFARAWAVGKTPNPCALCNRDVKFSALMEAAESYGCVMFATGHYARLERVHAKPPYSVRLCRGADERKDQSYFLSLVPKARFEKVLFPLGGMSKDEARRLVKTAGFAVPAPEESTDICFVPGGNGACARYLEREWAAMGIVPPPGGDVLLRGDDGFERRIGVHGGLWRFTEGQRRGLGIAHSEGLYVLGKDAARKALIVGPARMLGIAGCETDAANIFLPPELWPARLFVRVRYRQKAVSARVSLEGGGLRIVFDERQGFTAPGQVAAVYDGAGRVLAGGIIRALL